MMSAVTAPTMRPPPPRTTLTKRGPSGCGAADVVRSLLRVLLAVAFAPLVPAALAAQTTVGVTMTAFVEGSTTMHATYLLFGDVVPGEGVTVAASPTGGSGTPGQIMVDSRATQVNVAVPSEMTLLGPGGAIRARLECAYATRADALTVTPFDCGRGFDFQPGNAPGAPHVIFVGGSIGPSETAAKLAGAYTGTVTVTATYSTS